MSFIGSIPMSPMMATLSQTLLYGGLALLPTLIFQFAYVEEVSDRVRVRSDPDEIFDFIIVGAGTSGSVVANRLSEKYKVLLLEAGGEPFPLMSIPTMASLFPNNPSYDWRFLTVPQKKSCLSLKNKQSLWPRGKALGGTSNLNFMIYIRGHHLDYDNWAELVEDQRWNYKNFLPYFKKSEKLVTDEKDPINSTYHGFGGELVVERGNYRPIAPYFLEAAKELGYKIVDVNSKYDEGFGIVPYTTRNGRRWTTYSGFVEGIKSKRGNKLTIRKYSTVTRLLMKGSNNFVYGVEYERHGRMEVAKVSKEVILSAGTIGSPKILLMSGIGPKEHLQPLNIETKVKLPVGENLQDHVIAFVGPFTVKDKLTYLFNRDTDPRHVVNFFRSGTGPLSTSGVEATGLLYSKLENSTRGLKWPEIQLILVSLPIHKNGGAKVVSSLFNLKQEIGEEYYKEIAGKDSFHVMAVVSRPKSVGTIRLASKNYKDPPLIDPQYLTHPYDSEIILEGVDKVMEIVEGTKAFKKIDAKLSPTPFPPCKNYVFKSRAYWSCYLKHYTVSVYHPSGTCAMGKPGVGVVNSRLRVYGTANLRVIDASIQPQIISTNIQAVCVAIGEIGSDFVKETWEKHKG